MITRSDLEYLWDIIEDLKDELTHLGAMIEGEESEEETDLEDEEELEDESAGTPAFEVGDLVIYVGADADGPYEGALGAVRVVDDCESCDEAHYGVEWPGFEGGHSCDVGISDGRGWFVETNEIRPA